MDSVRTKRTRRNHPLAVLTSMDPGVCVPIAAIPLLREDSARGAVRIAAELLETHEILMNSVNLRVTAYLVPWLAMARFEGSRDQFDRSYMGQPKTDGGAVVPFFETVAAVATSTHAINRALGLHAKTGDTVNTMITEAYNLIWNMRAKNRSPNITQRTRLDTSLAPAFWLNSQWEHVVPDFDQAVIDGEIALSMVNPQITVKGLYIGPPASKPAHDQYDLDGVPPGAQLASSADFRPVSALGNLNSVYGELTQAGITISMAGLAQARKAQVWAKVRERFQGHDDEYIIDMLMSGLSIPDLALTKPILLADVTTKFAQAKRYATDAVNMTESAVSGGATVEFDLMVPQINTGGIIMMIAEALPDQLFERQRDPFFYTTAVQSTPTVRGLPDYLSDDLDVEKVEIVKNGQVDVDHATPNATFGYEPLNNKWTRWGPRLGGKFLRPAAGAANDIQRERLYAVEVVNPTLSSNFYIVAPGTMHKKPFIDTTAEPVELAVSGGVVITGNTQFGGKLVENTNLYDKVMADAPSAASQIVKP